RAQREDAGKRRPDLRDRGDRLCQGRSRREARNTAVPEAYAARGRAAAAVRHLQLLAKLEAVSARTDNRSVVQRSAVRKLPGARRVPRGQIPRQLRESARRAGIVRKSAGPVRKGRGEVCGGRGTAGNRAIRPGTDGGAASRRRSGRCRAAAFEV